MPKANYHRKLSTLIKWHYPNKGPGVKSLDLICDPLDTVVGRN